MEKNKSIYLFIVIIFCSMNIFAQKNKLKIISTSSLRPSTIIVDTERNRQDTILEFIEGSQLIESTFNLVENECAFIYRSDEGDMESFWFFLFVKNQLNSKWDLKVDSGVGIRVYHKNSQPSFYELNNTRLVTIYNNKREVENLIKISDDFKIKFEPKRN